MSTTTISPTARSERILLLDSLRGIAVLGILYMNIPSFSAPSIASKDPTLVDFTGLNYYLWIVDNWLLQGSQRAIFSMLFGAGVLLFISRLEKRELGTLPAEFFIKRQLWLFVFGLFNAYILLWSGDILFHYSIIGTMLLAFRRLSVKYLIVAASVCVLLQLARENIDLYREKVMIRRIEAVLPDTLNNQLTPTRRYELLNFIQKKNDDKKENKLNRMNSQIRAVTGSYTSLYNRQSERAFYGETKGMFHFLFFDILAFMFLGMAFFKNGIITGSHRKRTYWLMFIIGLGIGLPLSYLRIHADMTSYHFSEYLHSQHELFNYYTLSRTFRSIGIFGAIMVMYKSGLFSWLFNLMKPVGQMAFTNYLAQSVICALIFYRVGLGYFGKMERYEAYLVAAGIWIIQIVWSHIWLQYFHFGPCEWLWRTLTYWKPQPFFRSNRTEESVFK